MSKNITIENVTREQIAEFLPEAIALAVASYRKHMVKENEQSAFETHHKAAKVAISHIELLIKLAKWADLPDTSQESDAQTAELARLMGIAELEISAYQEEE